MLYARVCRRGGNWREHGRLFAGEIGGGMRWIIGAAFVVASGGASAQALWAPYCLHGDAGNVMCIYHTVGQCKSASQYLGGLCAPNVQRQNAPSQAPPVDGIGPLAMYEYVRAAGERGRQRALEEQEHRARLDLLRAQTDAARAAASPATYGAPHGQPRVLYSCRTPQGQENITAQPYVGCTVISVE